MLVGNSTVFLFGFFTHDISDPCVTKQGRLYSVALKSSLPVFATAARGPGFSLPPYPSWDVQKWWRSLPGPRMRLGIDDDGSDRHSHIYLESLKVILELTFHLSICISLTDFPEHWTRVTSCCHETISQAQFLFTFSNCLIFSNFWLFFPFIISLPLFYM